ncbi:hypothetical protein [Ketogulonicigenium robustum]|uniref:hypothetical protein n=1 Tax=Ketogulonicigenium robustum TaxID=92947 RepID=UPI0012F4EB04|nr:hypothetical protein [Ketogulonicigenium robustum]
MDREAGFAGLALFRRDRHQFHLLDQRSQRLLSLIRALGLRQASDQCADSGAVGLRYARVYPDRVRGGGGRELAFQFFPAGIQFDHTVLHLVRRHTGDDRVDQLLVVG